MIYSVIDKLQNNKIIETHTRWFDAFRALHIFTAHELKNGRKAHYAVEPEMIQAATPTLDELNLPSWAYQILAGEEQTKKAQTFLESGEARSGLVAPMAEHIKEMITPKPADEVAGDLVAKQVQEGKVVLGPDGEVLAHEVFMKKYARAGETLEDVQKRITQGVPDEDRDRD